MSGHAIDEKGNIKIFEMPFENEKDLQDTIERYPEALPISEINPKAKVAVPIGRELQTEVGPMDVVFLDDTGRVIIVECKLVENPEGRREVCAQAIEYSTRVQQWGWEIIVNTYQDYYGGDGEKIIKVFNRRLAEIQASNEDLRIDEEILKRRIRMAPKEPVLVIAGNNVEQRAMVLVSYLQKMGKKNGEYYPMTCVEYSRYIAKNRKDKKGTETLLLSATVKAATLLTTISSHQRLTLQKDEWIDMVDKEPARSIRLDLLEMAEKFQEQNKCKLIFRTKSLQICEPKNQKTLLGVEKDAVFFNFGNLKALQFPEEEVKTYKETLLGIVGKSNMGSGKIAASIKYDIFSDHRDILMGIIEKVINAVYDRKDHLSL